MKLLTKRAIVLVLWTAAWLALMVWALAWWVAG